MSIRYSNGKLTIQILDHLTNGHNSTNILLMECNHTRPTVWIPDQCIKNKMAFICLVFKWLGCLVFKWNSKIGPFGIKPPSDHLNTKQVWNQIPTVIRTNIFENNSSKINLNMFGVKCKVFLVCQQHFAVLKCFGCTTLLLIIEINKQICFVFSYLHFNKKFVLIWFCLKLLAFGSNIMEKLFK